MISIKRDSLESKALSWVRFPLACLVVLIHTAYTNDQSDICYYLGKLISSNLANIAVPTFFFISGYLFFAKYDDFGWYEYRNMLQDKTKRLLLPYLIWNCIAYYVYGLTNNFAGDIRPWELYRIFWAIDDGYVVTSLLGYKFSILSSPALGTFWFIRDLMVVMLLSPIIWWIIRKLKMWSLLIFILPWILKIGIPIKGFGLFALCFFPLGATFSICGKNIFDYAKRLGGYTSIIVILLLFINSYLNVGVYAEYLNKLFIVLGLISVIYISYIAIQRNPNSKIIKLGEASFFIYAFHALFIFNPMRHIIAPICLVPVLGNTLAYMTFFILKVCISIGIYFGLFKYCPNILAVLVGGKINKK